MKLLSYAQYKTLTKLPLNQFNIWLKAFYEAAFTDGLAARESNPDSYVVLDEDEMNYILTDCGVCGEVAEKIIGRLTDGKEEE